MNSLAGSLRSLRRATRLPSLVCAIVALLPAAHALDVTGDYESAGTIISTTLEHPGGPVSLHGLLALEFDLALAQRLYADTTRVTIRQTASRFAIECRDASGGVTWGGEWRDGVGYAVENDQVKLEFRSAKRYGHDAFVFRLSTDPKRNVLLLSVRRVRPSSFGPGETELGVFCFPMLPPARGAPRAK
ncbi:MAG: hypothetical protein HYV96_11690 [Opitutae bacterium]|nr:hypothetical protein [Opitutae bacterium]